MKALRLTLQILLPILVLLLGFLAAKKIATLGKPPTIAESTFVGPSVRVVTATATDLRIDVETQGTVEAFRAIDLAAGFLLARSTTKSKSHGLSAIC